MCVAEVLCYGGGSGREGGGGGGLHGSLARKGGPRRQGIEEMNWAACRGAVHRSAGARSVGLSGQEKRCSVVCAGRNHNPGRLAMGPYLLCGSRTAVSEYPDLDWESVLR